MKYYLVLQWPANSIGDYDRMIAIEEELESGLSSKVELDGHDMGSGEMNIFLRTDDPGAAFDDVRRLLEREAGWTQLRAAYRGSTSETYVVLWPPGLKDFSVG